MACCTGHWSSTSFPCGCSRASSGDRGLCHYAHPSGGVAGQERHHRWRLPWCSYAPRVGGIHRPEVARGLALALDGRPRPALAHADFRAAHAVLLDPRGAEDGLAEGVLRALLADLDGPADGLIVCGLELDGELPSAHWALALLPAGLVVSGFSFRADLLGDPSLERNGFAACLMWASFSAVLAVN